MKKIPAALFALAAMLGWAGAGRAADYGAVSLGFAPGDGVSAESAGALSEFFDSSFISAGRAALCPPDRAREIFILMPVCRDAACATAAARKVSADYSLAGQVSLRQQAAPAQDGQPQVSTASASGPAVAELSLHLYGVREGAQVAEISTACPAALMPQCIAGLAAWASSAVEKAAVAPSSAAPASVPAPLPAATAAIPVSQPSAPTAATPAQAGYTEAEHQAMQREGRAVDASSFSRPRTYPLGGEYGINANFPGFGLRWTPDDEIMLEGKAQFTNNNRIVGGRFYLLFPELAQTRRLVPYAGAEFSWSMSSYIKGGYAAGLFSGAEFMVTPTLGVGLDAGLFYVRVWNQFGNESDIGVVFNSGVTWYFGK